jgi:hypothetical protein
MLYSICTSLVRLLKQAPLLQRLLCTKFTLLSCYFTSPLCALHMLALAPYAQLARLL